MPARPELGQVRPQEGAVEVLHDPEAQQEREADRVEHTLKSKVFNMDTDPVTIFHIVRLSEIIGSIADHAENAGDMMRAMVAR